MNKLKLSAAPESYSVFRTHHRISGFVRSC